MILTSNTEATKNKVEFSNYASTVKGFQYHSNNSLQLFELKENNNNKTIQGSKYKNDLRMSKHINKYPRFSIELPLIVSRSICSLANYPVNHMNTNRCLNFQVSELNENTCTNPWYGTTTRYT